MNYLENKKVSCLNGQWSMCHSQKNLNFNSIDQLKKSDIKKLSAVVPGNFELDLQKNNVIDEPFFGMNIVENFKYELDYIWYYREFDAPLIKKEASYELVFEGLDTLCEIYLNGEIIAITDNMLVEHVIDITSKLKNKNELLIKISPVFYEAKKQDYPVHIHAIAPSYEAVYIRKAPHVYGWDIMCRAVSAGIWRDVYIREKKAEHLNFVYAITNNLDTNTNSAWLKFMINADIGHCYTNDYEIEIEGNCKDSKIYTRKKLLFEKMAIEHFQDNALFWWPRGKGDANLYEMKARIYKNNQIIDEIEFTFGIRTTRLERTSTTDQFGSGEFVFIINNEKTFCKGSNWVPLDAYHSRDIERVEKAIDMVADLECNILRCWGGNVYESELFYKLCDQKGIMIWQDFSMACAYYPQNEKFCKKIEVEARKVIKRLRQHPSVIIWSGDNEIDMFNTWMIGHGFNPVNNILTRKILPDVLKEEDFTRPYLPSSPYMDEEAYKYGLDKVTENHPWGPRDYFKGKYYTNQICHFASEIGYHGCPDEKSLEKFISKDKLWPYENNDEWTLHCTDPIPDYNNYGYRVELMAKQIREIFGFIPDNLHDFAMASQISQAEAKKFFIEMYRATKWRRTGIIWWNLLDGWPQMSDAIVDYYFNKKLAYTYIKASQQHVCVMFKEPENWHIELVVSNDTRLDEEIEFKVTDMKTEEVFHFGKGIAKADMVTGLGQIPFSLSLKTVFKIEWTGKNHSGVNHYLAGMPVYDFDEYKDLISKIYDVKF